MISFSLATGKLAMTFSLFASVEARASILSTLIGYWSNSPLSISSYSSTPPHLYILFTFTPMGLHQHFCIHNWLVHFLIHYKYKFIIIFYLIIISINMNFSDQEKYYRYMNCSLIISLYYWVSFFRLFKRDD